MRDFCSIPASSTSLPWFRPIRAAASNSTSTPLNLAAELGSDCVSLWSGAVRDGISSDEALKRLTQGLQEVLDYAALQGVVIAMEPEPGMFIDTTRRFKDFSKHNDMPNLRLTLDIGHLHCQAEGPIAEIIRRWTGRLVNVHVEDMKAGVHEHLMFAEGQIDFPPVIGAGRIGLCRRIVC